MDYDGFLSYRQNKFAYGLYIILYIYWIGSKLTSSIVYVENFDCECGEPLTSLLMGLQGVKTHTAKQSYNNCDINNNRIRILH